MSCLRLCVTWVSPLRAQVVVRSGLFSTKQSVWHSASNSFGLKLCRTSKEAGTLKLHENLALVWLLRHILTLPCSFINPPDKVEDFETRCYKREIISILRANNVHVWAWINRKYIYLMCLMFGLKVWCNWVLKFQSDWRYFSFRLKLEWHPESLIEAAWNLW